MVGYYKEKMMLVNVEIARHGCLACDNYRAIHQHTKVSYCIDGSKTVFVDTGCSNWKREALNAKRSNA